MKSLLIVLTIALTPALSFASIYSCSGAGFSIEVVGNPIEMRITGNGFNSVAKNASSSSTFDTVIAGNTASPAATVKLVIKDSSFANPGDRFNALVQVSSASGVRDFSGVTCIRGND